MLNWTASNRTVFDIETVVPDRALSLGQIELNFVFMLNSTVEIELFWHLSLCKQKLYLY